MNHTIQAAQALDNLQQFVVGCRNSYADRTTEDIESRCELGEVDLGEALASILVYCHDKDIPLSRLFSDHMGNVSAFEPSIPGIVLDLTKV